MLRKEIKRDVQGPFWNLIKLDVMWLSSEHLTVQCRVYDACSGRRPKTGDVLESIQRKETKRSLKKRFYYCCL
jgi:hypothetical protein